MRWLTGAMVLDTDGERFVRADIGIDGERITAIVPRASPAAGSGWSVGWVRWT